MNHSELVAIGKRWLRSNGCSVVVTEIASVSRETPDIIGWRYGESILIEAKTSRADFLSDKKKFFRQFPDKGMGNYRYYLAPKGLLKQSDLPDKWLLLECSESGRIHAGKKVHLWCSDGREYWFNASRQAEHELMYSCLRRISGKVGDVDLLFHTPKENIQVSIERIERTPDTS